MSRFLLSAEGILGAHVRRRLTGGWTDSWIEDVIQESLLAVASSYRDCRAESHREVVGWLNAIAKREIAELYRSEGEAVASRADLDTLLALPYPVLEGPSVRIGQALASLAAAVSDLNEAQHRLIWNRLIGAMTWREVGEDFGIAATSAKRRWQRLRKRLRRTSTGPT